MRKRSGVLRHEEEIGRLTLKELDAEISRRETRLRIAPDTYQRRSFEKRLHWLRRIRDRREEK